MLTSDTKTCGNAILVICVSRVSFQTPRGLVIPQPNGTIVCSRENVLGVGRELDMLAELCRGYYCIMRVRTEKTRMKDKPPSVQTKPSIQPTRVTRHRTQIWQFKRKETQLKTNRQVLTKLRRILPPKFLNTGHHSCSICVYIDVRAFICNSYEITN